ncbi:MAG TPA: amino acid adenylation domain-containing protein, partial [Flavobacteriales bacterium]
MHKFIPETRRIPVEFDPFAGPPLALTSPTTEPQREVWAASQMSAEASCSYNESVSLELTGPLDIAVLDRAVEQLVLRHEGLRSVFDSTGTRSVVMEQLPVRIELKDLSALPADQRKAQHAEIGRVAMNTPFDLLNGPLFRVIVFRYSANEHVVRIIGHHIVCDGWSLSVMIGDLSIIYSALLHGDTPRLPDAVPYSRYAQELNAYYRSDANKQVTGYWKNLFAAPLPQVDLPTDRPRPLEKTWTATRIDIELPQPLVAGLKEVGTRYGSSFVTTLLAVYEVLIARITGQRDIVVGLPAAGQSDMGMRDLVGHCVSLLPIRSTIDEDLPFHDYLRQRRKGVLDAFDNQRFTFSTLLRELNVPRLPGRVPLVPIIFNLDVEMADRVAFEGITHVFKSDPRAFEQFELAMNASSFSDRLVLEWSFNTDLFDAATVRGWMDELTMLVETVIKDPTRSLIDLIEGRSTTSELPAPEWAGTVKTIPAELTVATEFDRIARLHADRPALVQGERQLTYAQLRDRVDALAAHLLKQGLQPGRPVALSATPGFDLLTGLLAIVRAGGAFVPIDHTYPEERLRYLLENSGATLLLTQRELANAFSGFRGTTVMLDEHRHDAAPAQRPAFSGNTNDPVYVIYTSGSTGEPKGTVVPHRGVLRTVRDQQFMAFGPELNFLFHLSISFDACQIAVMGALLNGGTLVIPEQAQPTLSDLMRTVVRHKVNSMATAGGYFKLMIDEHIESLRGMRHLMTGGDAISVPHVRKALRMLGPGIIINAYGPTENSMLSTYFTVNNETDLHGPLPIGRTINNSTVHVLDEQLRPVRIGVKGELYTGGPGVALGYWNRPEQTAERFIADPFSDIPDAKLYRTGDMVRWTSEGQLEFIGRVDDQVKIRGFRVELGEVEAALNDLGTVKDKVVMALPEPSGEKRLVLYVVPKDPTIRSTTSGADAHSESFLRVVRDHMASKLPEHMRPMDLMVI